MTVKSNSLLLAIFALGVAFSMGGCAITRPKPAIGATSTPVVSNNITPKNIAATPIKAPVKILVAIDLTTSSDENKVPTPTISQMKDLAKVAMEHGGDVRVDAIESNSDKSMVAVSFSQPEAALPALEPLSEDNVNPLDRPKLRQAYAEKQRTYTVAQQQYQERTARRQADNQQQLDRFLAQVQPILKKRGTYNSTDIVGMVKRGNLFLNEPDPSKTREPQRIALLITDGVETVRRNPDKIKFADRTDVTIVGCEKGILPGQQFESLDSAIRYISNKY
jgi:membrane-associated protease RseP (regulator of RpoE activity)